MSWPLGGGDHIGEAPGDMVLLQVLPLLPASRAVVVGSGPDARAFLLKLRSHGIEAWLLNAPMSSDPSTVAGASTASVAVPTVLAEPSAAFDVAIALFGLGRSSPPHRRDLVAVLCEKAPRVVVPAVDEPEASELASLFAEHGFFTDEATTADQPSPILVFRDRRLPPSDRQHAGIWGGTVAQLVEQRDDAIGQYGNAVREHDRLAERFNQLSRETERRDAELESVLLRRRVEVAAAQSSRHQLELVAESDRRELAAARSELAALEATKLIRYTRPARRLYGRLRHLSGAQRGVRGTHADASHKSYDDWVRAFDPLDDQRREGLVDRLSMLAEHPLVSVVLPVYDTPERYLREALDSVLAQVYEDWELCVVDDCSAAAWIPKVLDEYSALDTRIRVVRRDLNGHISAASNTGIEMARGTWLVFLDHDDTLSPYALALAVLALSGRPEVALLYSDQDKIDADGRRYEPYFKPDFDPLLILAQNYVCHLTMARRDLVQQIGGFRTGMEGSQDWDLVLRLTEHLRTDQIVHVPHVLYHWRAHPGSTAASLSVKQYAVDAGRRAVEEHLARTTKRAEVASSFTTGMLRVKWDLPRDPPKVSIVVPTRDGRYLARCLESLYFNTGYPNYEVLVIDNGSVREETINLLIGAESWAMIIRDERPFNYSALNNAAVRLCSGELVCLLNDDCLATDYGWLEEMVSQVLQDGVGVVGAKLFYADGRVQHAGVTLGVGGVAGHAQRFSDPLSYGYFGRLFTARSLSAVTAACMVVRRDVFEQVGGLDEVNLAVAFNDVDFCLRVRGAGWRVVWTPFATLTHFESASRGFDDEVRPEGFRRETDYMQQRWGPLLTHDPAYSPNLTLEHEDYSLAFPPRVAW